MRRRRESRRSPTPGARSARWRPGWCGSTIWRSAPVNDAGGTGGAGEAGVLSRIGEMLADGLRYWEPRRLLYNGVLAAVVLAHFAHAWPAARILLTWDNLLGLFVLAVLANVAYCAAYVADL